MLGTNNEKSPVSSGAHGEALVTVNRDSGEITYEARASDVIPRLEQGIRGSHPGKPGRRDPWTAVPDQCRGQRDQRRRALPAAGPRPVAGSVRVCQ